MADVLPIEPARTALLVLDVENDIVANAVSDGGQFLSRLEHLVSTARRRGVSIIYVVVGFRPGYPEARGNPHYATVIQMGRLVMGSPGCEVHASVAPKDDEPTIVKHRVGAFAHTDLDLILRVSGIDSLILTGITTSGVVLSTLRHAYDHDYKSIVVSDGCIDRDPDVHRILVERVFPRQARVMTTAELIEALGG
jgi:nicotinamidase-related amidase